MIASGTKTGTTLTEQLDAQRDEEEQTEVIPAEEPKIAEVLPPAPGEITFTLELTIGEIGAISASLQTCVQWRAITQPSQLNVVNSVLRKFHDAKLKYIQEHE